MNINRGDKMEYLVSMSSNDFITGPLAEQLAANAPIATQYILDVVNRGLEMPFAEAAAYESSLFGLVAATDDMREGTRAFLEKRKPAFKGR